MDLKFTGHTPRGIPIVSGAYILHMRDTHGIPLDVQCAILDERGWGFDVAGFVAACHASPNYSMGKCLRLLKSTTESRRLHGLFEAAVCYHLTT